MRMRYRLSVIAVAALTGGLPVLVGCTSQPSADAARHSVAEAAFTPRSGPIGQHPREAGAKTFPIRRTVLDNIANTPPGEAIRMVAWNFDDEEIAKALIRADSRTRDVDVQVLLWGRYCFNPENRSEATQALTTALNRSTRDNSFLKCIDHSARGKHRTGQLHQKSFTFSRIGSTKYVSLVTSYNPTDHAMENQYNVAFQFVWNKTLYDHLTTLFKQQRQDKERPDVGCPTSAPYNGKLFQHSFPGGGLVAYPMDCRVQDPILGALRRIDSTAERRSAIVKVATSGFTHDRAVEIAEELVSIRKAGASVKVIHTDGAGPNVRQTLNEGGVASRDTQSCGPEPKYDLSFNHAKMLLLTYVPDGKSRIYRSWIGSDNFAEGSINNDELLVQLTKQNHFTAFNDFFQFTWNKEDPRHCRPG